MDKKYIIKQTKLFASFDLLWFHHSLIFITAQTDHKIYNVHRGILSLLFVFPHGYSHFFQVPTECGSDINQWRIYILGHFFQQIKRICYVGNLGALLVFDDLTFICDSNSQFFNSTTNQAFWTKSGRKEEYQTANNSNDLENCYILWNTNSCPVYRTMSSSGLRGMYIQFNNQSSITTSLRYTLNMI